MSSSIKIKKVGSDRIFEIDIHKQGENAQPCPDCANDRRKKSAKSFSYNAEKAQGYCNHCQSRFHEYKPYSKEVFYEMPKFENKTQLSEKAVQYAHSRMINSETIIKMQIASAEEFMPQSNKIERCICFPYYRNGELVNVKYRDGKKNFKLSKGAELIWYNYDAIINAKEIIIVEGEWDALSFISDGFENVISVPNGANVGKMSYLDETINLFDTIEKIYIAVDNDEKGLELRAELIRRFGFEKCYIVEFNEYKDANDCLMNNGYGVLKEFINKARVPKIEGILEAEDYLSDIMDLYEKGMQKGKITGLKWLDTLITWETKRLATWTGTPSCFHAGQLIHTKLGVKKISEIKEGEKVLTYNHDKKYNEYREVILTHKFTKRKDKLYKIKLKDGTEIRVTEDHEFYTGIEYVKIKNILLSLQNKKI